MSSGTSSYSMGPDGGRRHDAAIVRTLWPDQRWRLSSSPLPRCDEYALACPKCLGAAFVATDNSVEALYQVFGVRPTRLPIWTGAENSSVHPVPRRGHKPVHAELCML